MKNSVILKSILVTIMIFLTIYIIRPIISFVLLGVLEIIKNDLIVLNVIAVLILLTPLGFIINKTLKLYNKMNSKESKQMFWSFIRILVVCLILLINLLINITKINSI